jgi:hypothetical protein
MFLFRSRAARNALRQLEQRRAALCSLLLGRREGAKSVRACTGSVELDVASLLWTRGRDFPIAMLSGRLRCPDVMPDFMGISTAFG